MKTKYPELEKIIKHGSGSTDFPLYQRDGQILQRNQEIIYKLLQEINEKLPKEPKTPKVFYED